MSETPQNTGHPEANPLLRPWQTPFETPPFAEILPEHFLPAFERAHGIPIEIEWNPTNLLMKAIEQGGRADAVLVTDEAIDAFVASKVESA